LLINLLKVEFNLESTMYARIFKSREATSFSPSYPVAEVALKSDDRNKQSSEVAPDNTLPGFAAILRGPSFAAVTGRKKSASPPAQPSRDSTVPDIADSANAKSKK
jgi:hypothetical protein